MCGQKEGHGRQREGRKGRQGVGQACSVKACVSIEM